jgi:serine/threonine protein kinase
MIIHKILPGDHGYLENLADRAWTVAKAASLRGKKVWIENGVDTEQTNRVSSPNKNVQALEVLASTTRVISNPEQIISDLSQRPERGLDFEYSIEDDQFAAYDGYGFQVWFGTAVNGVGVYPHELEALRGHNGGVCEGYIQSDRVGYARISVPNSKRFCDQAFLIKKLDRVIKSLDANGISTIIEQENDYVDININLPNKKEDFLSLIDLIDDLLTYPDFVHDLSLPPALYEDLLSVGYKNIRTFAEGGTRNIFEAEFYGETRVIKIDKPSIELESPRAIRHTERGYNTANELSIMQEVRDPEKHHLTALRDVRNLELYGSTGIVTIEKKVDGKSLEEIAGTLSGRESYAVCLQITEAVKYMSEELSIFHRDLKPSNILVDMNGDEPDAFITDPANGIKKDKVEAKYMATSGGHMVTHPLLMDPFVDEPIAFDERCELYSLGNTMYFAITGKHIFDYNPDTNTATEVATGASLLDDSGKIDVAAHEAALDRALNEIDCSTENSDYIRPFDANKPFDPWQKPEDMRDLYKPFILKQAIQTCCSLTGPGCSINQLYGLLNTTDNDIMRIKEDIAQELEQQST